MTQVTFNVPPMLATLPRAERDALLRAGLFEAVRSRIRQLTAEIQESNQQIRHYEEKYGLSLLQFEAECLSGLDTLQAHEDYNDWFFWTEAQRQQREILAELQRTHYA